MKYLARNNYNVNFGFKNEKFPDLCIHILVMKPSKVKNNLFRDIKSYSGMTHTIKKTEFKTILRKFLPLQINRKLKSNFQTETFKCKLKFKSQL